MKIHEFEVISGSHLAEIPNQARFFYQKSSWESLQQAYEQFQAADYPGNLLRFYDIESMELFSPFELEQAVSYGEPVYQSGKIYVPKADFRRGTVAILEYEFGAASRVFYERDIKDTQLENLYLVADPLCLISQTENLCCYYPREFSIALGEEESFRFFNDKEIYLSKWIEEELIKDSEIVDYKYYEKLIVRDFEGKVLSERAGCLQRIGQKWYLA
ncbi:MAG: hypothetical protein Q4P08_06620 [Eubacteriales bacterium]|nr:hypothetical protein [Eubacteriales bacterium]